MNISEFILILDSYLVRKGMLTLLNRIRGVRILKEFASSDPFMPYLESHHVDFIIISEVIFTQTANDFMARPDLLEKTILLKESQDADISESPPDSKAYPSIHLTDDKETILGVIRNILDSRADAIYEKRPVELSPRETTIVKLVSMGLTNRQIAEKLFLSTHTVMTHRKNINSKLGIKSVSGLTIYAIVNNIITIEELST